MPHAICRRYQQPATSHPLPRRSSRLLATITPPVASPSPATAVLLIPPPVNLTSADRPQPQNSPRRHRPCAGGPQRAMKSRRLMARSPPPGRARWPSGPLQSKLVTSHPAQRINEAPRYSKSSFVNSVSRKICNRRPGPSVSPACTGTTVQRPSACRTK
jgi:hypothetical protein